MRFLSLVIFFAFISLAPLASFATPAGQKAPVGQKARLPWTKFALQLTGESDLAREKAIASLRNDKTLPVVLRKELRGPKRPLALDVIAALKMKEFIPELLDLAEKDSTGFTYLTLNVLIDSKNQAELVRKYKKNLFQPQSPWGEGPNQAVLLETLGLLREPLSVKKLLMLFSETEWPEVQAAILTYTRWMLFHQRRPEYLAVLKQSFSSETLQVQEQAMALFKELPKRTQTKYADWLPSSGLETTNSLSNDSASTAPDLDVRIVIGYKDARPERFVGDRFEKLIVVRKLTSPCPTPSTFSCGFVRDAKDMNLFKKVIANANTERLVHLHLVSSSASMDDDKNRKDPYQVHLSETATKSFLSGLQKADIVFYIGHSRDGGGPSFVPPELLKNKHVNYDLYRQQRGAARSMLATLQFAKRSKTRPLMLALLSCASRKHFVKDLHRVSPNIRTLSVGHLLYYSDALYHTFNQLSELLKEKASDSVLKSLRQTG